MTLQHLAILTQILYGVAFLAALRLLWRQRDVRAGLLLLVTSSFLPLSLHSPTWQDNPNSFDTLRTVLLPVLLITLVIYSSRTSDSTTDGDLAPEPLEHPEIFSRTLETLRVSEEKFAKAFHASPDAITLSTLSDGKFHEVNPSFRIITGYSREEALGRTSLDLDLWTVIEDRRRLVKEIREHGCVRDMETIFRHKDGRLLHCVISAEVIELEKEPNLLFIVQDISDKKQAEADRDHFVEELEAKNAELERFAYTVSHDLRSPLVTIQGFLGLLRDDIRKGHLDSMETDMQRISAATRTMQRLLDEILELSRIGRVVNKPTDIDLVQLAHEARELVDGALTQAGTVVEIQPDLPAVWGDQRRMLEVLQNLLENAAKFMGDQADPRIEVGWRLDAIDQDAFAPNQQSTVFFVRDNGIGIAEPYREKVFGLFERLSNDIQGTGIGLALVRRILQVHGGNVWVESAGLGHGSTFCFSLPSQDESPLEAAE